MGVFSILGCCVLASSLHYWRSLSLEMTSYYSFFCLSFIGISMLALVTVQGYHGYLLFVWIYGLFLGGMEVALRVYCYERLRIKQFSRGWGYIQGSKAIPYLIGLPITQYISDSSQDVKSGFYFSFTFCILGGCVLFLMECFKGESDHSFYCIIVLQY